MSAIGDYFDDMNRVKAEWRAHWVLPYASAYTNAYARFIRTLDDQDKADAMRAQIAVAVLSIGFGGVFCGMLGKSSVGAASLQGGINVLTRRNMTRTLAVIQHAQRNPAAQFVAGQAWDTATSILTDRTKSVVSALLNPTQPANELIALRPRDLITRSEVARDKIEQYLELVFAAAHRVGEDIRDRGGADQDALAAELRRAPFFNSPTRDIIQQRGNGTPNAELDLELAMYMVLVMNCDYTASGTINASTSVPSLPPGARIARIDELSSSSDYPEEVNDVTIHYTPLLPRWSILASGVTRRYVEIRFDQLGGHIRDRIDALYRRRHNRAFFARNLDLGEIRRAEQCLEDMNRRYAAGAGPQQTGNVGGNIGIGRGAAGAR